MNNDIQKLLSDRLDGSALKLEPSTRQALNEVILKGVARVTNQRDRSDEAVKNFELLLDALATDVGPLDSSKIETVLARFCPFWPFCD